MSRVPAGMRRTGVAIVLATSVACGSSAADVGRPGEAIERLETDAVPARILGLNVAQEAHPGSLDVIGTTYVARTALYSMRSDDLVHATLQITEFADDAEYEKSEFRETVVDRIGSARPQPVTLGNETVYLTTGTKQIVAVWFRGAYFFVLNIRDDFDRPRSLIRAALALPL